MNDHRDTSLNEATYVAHGETDIRDNNPGPTDIVTLLRIAATCADPDEWPDTDDAEWTTVLKVVRDCALAWDPSTRLLGNVRAKDIVRAIDTALCDLLPHGR